MKNKNKIIRELRRVGRQADNLLTTVKGRALGLVWPFLRPAKLSAIEGALPASDKIALFLVYQPKGVAASTLETLRHVAAQGFAPFVVCNGGVPEADIAGLQQHAWQVITRPNLGYDFGGYRDGIWFLKQQGITPDRLLILNDTLWFPALDGATGPGCLGQLLDLPGEYASLSNFVYRPKSGRSDDLVRKAYPSSFCFWLSKKVWQSEAFDRYWQELPLHAAKARVVQSGEVGFGRAMTLAGFAPQVVVDHGALKQQVMAMTPAEQALFVQRLPVVNMRWRIELDRVVAQVKAQELPADDLAGFLDRLLPELNPWDSLAVNGLVSGQIDFIKKANLKNPQNAQRFLAMAQEADLSLGKEVRLELEGFAKGAS